MLREEASGSMRKGGAVRTLARIEESSQIFDRKQGSLAGRSLQHTTERPRDRAVLLQMSLRIYVSSKILCIRRGERNVCGSWQEILPAGICRASISGSVAWLGGLKFVRRVNSKVLEHPAAYTLPTLAEEGGCFIQIV